VCIPTLTHFPRLIKGFTGYHLVHWLYLIENPIKPNYFLPILFSFLFFCKFCIYISRKANQNQSYLLLFVECYCRIDTIHIDDRGYFSYPQDSFGLEVFYSLRFGLIFLDFFLVTDCAPPIKE